MKGLILASILLLSMSACVEQTTANNNITIQEGEAMYSNYITTQNTIGDVISHPSFEGFGQFILPLEWGYDEKMPLTQISYLLPYHSNIDAQRAVDTINVMIDEANNHQLFYDIYDDEKKENTGLFFFKGEANAPFAIICAGGGFSYVGSIHEAFPYAIKLNKKGYNAFVIQYRIGGAQVACEDLAAAISFIFQNAEKLEVDTNNYSIWGGSAGARMAAYIGSYGTTAFGQPDLEKPSAVIMQYTGHTDYSDKEPATFVAVGENDGIANWRTMQRRINILDSMGVETEFHKYPNIGHGFGLGIGTSAEGWFDLAVQFWEKQINKERDR